MIGTFLENETGMNTVKELDSSKKRIQINVSDKAGLLEENGKFLRVFGITTSKYGYDEAIYLFNTVKTADFDAKTATIDDFDILNSDHDLEWSKKRKENTLKRYSKVGDNMIHAKTKEAIDKMDENQLSILRKNRIVTRQSSEYGYISTLIHEGVHALKGSSEYTPRISQIKSYCECNPDCSECGN